MIKVLFMRHGESTDDVDDQYGGWADFDLTHRGKKQIRDKLPEIKKLGVHFEAVLSSPLKRARQSADIIGEALGLRVEILEYVKEMNSYGVLTGMKKSEAKKKYPDQVQRSDRCEYVDGSERNVDLIKRVEKSIQLIESMNYENVVVATHGNYLKCLFTEVLKKKLTKKGDGGFVLVEFSGNRNMIVKTSGIEYE